MVHKFNNCVFKNIGTIAKSNSDIDLEFNQCKVETVHRNAFELTEGSNLTATSTNFSDVRGQLISISGPDLLSKLNLPDDTDIQDLIILFRELQNSPQEQHRQIISSSFLSNLNNLTGIINNIMQALPHFPQF